jgi:uncharacterized protein YjbI with pentapeptide repeats
MPGVARPLLPSKSKPPLAEQARDLKALRDVVVDAAAISAGLWFSYVFLLLYLLIAVAGVTHRNLFFEDAVRLPFLSVDLPLVSFFVIGPMLFLIVHAYVLIHFVLFAGKVGIFHSELQTQIGDEGVRAQLRWQLPSNIFVQALAGAREVSRGVTGHMLRLIAQISLVVGPIALLLLFQIQFLPYHPKPILALWLRLTVAIDIALLWMLWPSIARGKLTWIAWRDISRVRIVPAASARLFRTLLHPSAPARGTPLRFRNDWYVVRTYGAIVAVALLSLIPIAFVFTISTYQDEWLGAYLRITPVIRSVHELLFEGEPDVTGRTSSWFSNRIVLPDQSFIDPDKLDKIDVSHSFQGRDLRRAILNRADLRKASFIGAELNGASFLGAKLQNARLGCPSAETEPNPDSCAQLQGALFDSANMQGAILTGAQMQGAYLRTADLQGADLTNVQLQAKLGGANMQGAFFFGAKLQAADFHEAKLQATYFFGAELQGADFSAAGLQGASFSYAGLQGAILSDAHLEGSTFRSARISHVSPDLNAYLADFGDCDPDTMPWTASQYGNFAAWRDRVLTGVAKEILEDAKTRLFQRLEGPLNPIAQTCQNAKQPQDQEVANSLSQLACSRLSAPNVARGLIKNGRAAIVADRLRKGMSEPNSCPGVIGFTSSDWEKLDALVPPPSTVSSK